MKCQFLAIDAGRQRISLIDTTNPAYGWSRSLADFPGVRDMQRIGKNRALISFEHGFFEVTISSGEIAVVCERWSRVSSAHHLTNGATLVAGINLDGSGGINVVTLDREYRQVRSIRRDGDYVGLIRPTNFGTYLLCMEDHVLETDGALISLRAMRAPGFGPVWKAERLPDGGTLASAGSGGFMARFDARGYLTEKFGAADSVPAEVAPHFYATFQVLDDGRIMVANYQGPGEGNGEKGRQLLTFAADGAYLDGWSAPDRISSLQGILVV